MKLSTYVQETPEGDVIVHGRRVLLAAIITTAVIAALVFAAWGVGIVTAPWVGRQNAHRIINNPLNQIEQYNHFFTLDADIHTEATEVHNAQAQLDAFNKANPPGTPDPAGQLAQQRSVLMSNVTGAADVCSRNVNRYNADAVAYTTADFLSKSLPAREDLTTCEVPNQ